MIGKEKRQSHLLAAVLATGILLSTLGVAPARSARGAMILYVDADASEQPNDGSSWCRAFLSLSEALWWADSAAGPVVIKVAGGVYVPDTDDNTRGQSPNRRTATFQLVSGLTLEGGYAGCGSADPDERDIATYETILSGDVLGDDGPEFANTDDNIFHVLTGYAVDATTTIEGFTISGGNADDNGKAVEFPAGSGGGLALIDSAPTIRNCIFQNNQASLHGGGAYIEFSNGTSFIDCAFENNRAQYNGAGLMVDVGALTVSATTFSRNSLSYTGSNGGGAACFGVILDLDKSAFIENTAGDSGGGLFVGSYPTITSIASVTNSTWIGNIVDFTYGAGAGAAFMGTGLSMAGCDFSDNRATGSFTLGGGLLVLGCDTDFFGDECAVSISKCRFDGNSAGGAAGGASVNADATMDRCVFTNNSLTNTMPSYTTFAGGLSIGPGVTLKNSRFSGNSADLGGGISAGANQNSDEGATIENCLIEENTANYNGAGIYCNLGGPRIINCLITGNQSQAQGGGLYLKQTMGAELINCTIVDNQAGPGPGGEAGGAVYAHLFEENSWGNTQTAAITNSILSGNTPDQIGDRDHDAFNQPTVSYSYVQGGITGVGNINEPPSFIDEANRDYRLAPGSSGIDAGDNSALSQTTLDLAANPRFIDDPGTSDTGSGTSPIVDMGAFEYQLISCIGDLNNSGLVDTTDMYIMLDNWGTNISDINRDGTTDLMDLVAMGRSLGICPAR